MGRRTHTGIVAVACLFAGVAVGAEKVKTEKPRLAVVDFKVLGDVGIKDAGRTVAALLLTRFGTGKYQLIERMQLVKILEEHKLKMADIVSNPALVRSRKLKGVRYLVVGEVSKLGDLGISARVVDVATGDIGRTAEVSAEDARGLKGKLTQLAEVLSGKKSPPPPKALTLDLGGGVTMKLALIPAGEFRMGSPKDEAGRDDDEGPQRQVTISKPFHMGATEVTQAQWQAVMGTEPWKGQAFAKNGGENAASYISWDDATAFCKKLSQKTGRTIRLPTEAEWEYACRAGSKTVYCFGDDASELGDYAWYEKNAWDIGKKYAHAVGQKKPNAWALHDMHGNVWEWCGDWYDNAYYAGGGNTEDPAGPASGSSRVLRGGSFLYYGVRYCRAAFRFRNHPDFRRIHYGFRVVLPLVGRGLRR